MQRPQDRPEFGPSLEVLLSALYHRIVERGDVVIDGGANGGLHTVPLARLVGRRGRVIAFEPLAKPYRSLHRWLSAKRLTHIVSLRRAALGSTAGKVPFYRHKTNDGLSSLQIMSGDAADWEELSVDKVRLDDEQIPGRCSFIKLDLEGGEYDALLGAQALVARDRPIIALEHGFTWAAQQFGYAPEDFLMYFERLNYSLWDFANVQVRPENYSDKFLVWEFIAAPAESPLVATIGQTISEFLQNYERVPAASNWNDTASRVEAPFSTGYWPRPPWWQRLGRLGLLR